MQVKFYANMRTIFGIPELDLEDVHIKTFRESMAYLLERFPEAKHHLVNSNDSLRQDVPVFVDGRNPRLTSVGLDTPLKPDSVISFFSPISSGRMNVEVLREPTFRNRSDE